MSNLDPRREYSAFTALQRARPTAARLANALAVRQLSLLIILAAAATPALGQAPLGVNPISRDYIPFEITPEMEGKDPTLAVADEAPPPPPLPQLNDRHLSCVDKADSQHIILTSKMFDGKEYEQRRLGCIKFQSQTHLLDEEATLALDDAVAYLLQLPNVIRVYIDLPPEQADSEIEELVFRKRAFAVKNYLHQKGIYAHLQNNREQHFPSRFATAQPEEKPVQEAPKPAPKPVKKGPPPKPAHPDAAYAYLSDWPAALYPGADPSTYSAPSGGGFQFVPMQPVYFGTDKFQLSARSKSMLDSTARYILDRPETQRLIIRAHTDYDGPAAYNVKLADRRAQAVYKYLAKQGVPEALMTIDNRGEHVPVDENWTRPGRARNRRVELYAVQTQPTLASSH